jgi:hypothetical protein
MRVQRGDVVQLVRPTNNIPRTGTRSTRGVLGHLGCTKGKFLHGERSRDYGSLASQDNETTSNWEFFKAVSSKEFKQLQGVLVAKNQSRTEAAGARRALSLNWKRENSQALLVHHRTGTRPQTHGARPLVKRNGVNAQNSTPREPHIQCPVAWIGDVIEVRGHRMTRQGAGAQ